MFGFDEEKFNFYLINTTAGLAILTSVSYFYAGLSKKGFVILSLEILSFLFSFLDIQFFSNTKLRTMHTLLYLGYFAKYVQPTPILF
jgi:hypothetical protein